jgi:hypothetical protein
MAWAEKKYGGRKKRVWPGVAVAVCLAGIGYGVFFNGFDSFIRKKGAKTELRELTETSIPISNAIKSADSAGEAGTVQTNFEYSIKKGDVLWHVAENLGVAEKDIGNFINRLVEDQSNYSDNRSFIKRISKDIIYVEKGKARRGSIDKIAGDCIIPGDNFVLPQEMISRYNISGKSLKDLGFTGDAKIDDSADNGILGKYISMRSAGKNSAAKENLKACRKDFENIVDKTARAYRRNIKPSEIARKSPEAILQKSGDVYKVLAEARIKGQKLKGKFNYGIAAASGDINLVLESYSMGKTYKTIAREFRKETGMRISSSSIYRILSKNRA